MLIAHRLFENYNQDLNKYVDLPGHQLNFYNNSDLPANLFEDPEHWFYEISPNDLLKHTRNKPERLPEEIYKVLQQSVVQISENTTKANSLRLSIAEAINRLDMNKQDELYSVYEMLEEAVDAFDLLQAQAIILQDQIEKSTEGRSFNRSGVDLKRLERQLSSIYSLSTKLLMAVKNEDVKQIQAGLKELKKEKKSFSSFSLEQSGAGVSAIYVMARNRILNNLNSLVENTEAYVAGQAIPETYALYGNTYFFYNTQLINKINRYGNGLVPAINEMIDILSLNIPHKFEVPHYLTIIYPKKVEKQIPVIQSSVADIQEAPTTLQNRMVVMSNEKHQILVDSSEPTLELFDHLKQDGDIVSLNFNGDWIFENLSLERKPRKFILKLNSSGKNFLILHAINEGSVPPNTIGINYVHKGRKKRYILQSNLRTSQMVEIKLDE